MKNILIAIDFNDSEKTLVDMALQWAKPYDAKVWLLHVADPEPEFVGFGVGPQYIRDSIAAELRKEHRKIQQYSGYLRENGVEAEGLLIQGATISMILKEAKTLNIDLIITGHHEHGLLYKAFFGSVAKELLKKTRIPVLVVPVE